MWTRRLLGALILVILVYSSSAWADVSVSALPNETMVIGLGANASGHTDIAGEPNQPTHDETVTVNTVQDYRFCSDPSVSLSGASLLNSTITAYTVTVDITGITAPTTLSVSGTLCRGEGEGEPPSFAVNTATLDLNCGVGESNETGSEGVNGGPAGIILQAGEAPIQCSVSTSGLPPVDENDPNNNGADEIAVGGGAGLISLTSDDPDPGSSITLPRGGGTFWLYPRSEGPVFGGATAQDVIAIYNGPGLDSGSLKDRVSSMTYPIAPTLSIETAYDTVSSISIGDLIHTAENGDVTYSSTVPFRVTTFLDASSPSYAGVAVVKNEDGSLLGGVIVTPGQEQSEIFSVPTTTAGSVGITATVSVPSVPSEFLQEAVGNESIFNFDFNVSGLPQANINYNLQDVKDVIRDEAGDRFVEFINNTLTNNFLQQEVNNNPLGPTLQELQTARDSMSQYYKSILQIRSDAAVDKLFQAKIPNINIRIGGGNNQGQAGLNAARGFIAGLDIDDGSNPANQPADRIQSSFDIDLISLNDLSNELTGNDLLSTLKNGITNGNWSNQELPDWRDIKVLNRIGYSMNYKDNGNVIGSGQFYIDEISVNGAKKFGASFNLGITNKQLPNSIFFLKQLGISGGAEMDLTTDQPTSNIGISGDIRF